MAATGRVQYHEPGRSTARILIDADGVPGNRIDPEYHWMTVPLHDARAPEDCPTFDRDGLRFVTAPTTLRSPEAFDEARPAYEIELRQLLSQQLGADEVVVFDHTLRTETNRFRPPSFHVHCDYTRRSADQRMLTLLGADRARAWHSCRFAIVNAWRPLVHPVERAPLGFVLPRSVAPEDWVDVDIIFPQRRGQIRGLAYSEGHRWTYLDRIRPEQVALFTVYANQGVSGVPHAAIDIVETHNDARPRQSIESRMFVRWA
ncbi:MAG: hypothetical protein K0V04_40380 [Deltaproteobacteria bacterium]|nr:hypothetical protein [Deltaproteobacteria bacterium]